MTWYPIRYHRIVDVGEAMRTARLASGSTLRALAKRAGTSHSALAAYESNAKVPRADTMYRVLEAAGSRVVVTRADELDWDDRVAKGRELEELLRFTAHFPTSRPGPLRDVRFGKIA